MWVRTLSGKCQPIKRAIIVNSVTNLRRMLYMYTMVLSDINHRMSQVTHLYFLVYTSHHTSVFNKKIQDVKWDIPWRVTRTHCLTMISSHTIAHFHDMFCLSCTKVSMLGSMLNAQLFMTEENNKINWSWKCAIEKI